MPLDKHYRTELSAPSHDRRAAACAELGEQAVEGDEAVIAALTERLGDPHPKVRLAAATTLSLGPVAMMTVGLLDALQNLPESARAGHRAILAHTLSLLPVEPDGAVGTALLDELRHEDSDVRFHALTGLNRLGRSDDAFKGAVAKLLHDPDDEVAAVAATAAADFGLTAEVETILARWETSNGFAERQFALAAGYLGATQVASTLAQAFTRGLDAIEAADALVSLGGEEAKAAFSKVARSWLAHPVLKARAAVALCELEHPDADVILERCLGHRRNLVRHATIEWMGLSGRTEFIRRLTSMLAEPSHRDAAHAAVALGFFDDPEARQALESAAKNHVVEEVREEAVAALESR